MVELSRPHDECDVKHIIKPDKQVLVKFESVAAGKSVAALASCRHDKAESQDEETSSQEAQA
jgi:hypothetical protein